MSHIRATTEYTYVNEENPGDYVFTTCGHNENQEYIEDYGNICNATVMEFITRIIKNPEDYANDKLFVDYTLKKLAEKLRVKMKEGHL